MVLYITSGQLSGEIWQPCCNREMEKQGVETYENEGNRLGEGAKL